MSDDHRFLEPECTADIVEAVKECVVEDTALRIHDAVHTAFSDSVRHLSLPRMKDVVDYPARDMTITVQAGMPACELNQILAQERQQLPIDCFRSDASVGAIVASDTAGPRQYGYGTLRDYVIGIEAVDGQGRVFHAGGRVVKNVAGYDLCRLLVGSRGVLAVITQLTFKLKPLPDQTMLQRFRCQDVEAFSATLDRLNTSAATPVILDFSCRPAGHEFGPGSAEYEICVGVEGSSQSCQWQMEQLQQECEACVEVPSESQSSADDTLDQYCRSFGYAWECLTIRCRPSQVAAISSRLAANGYGSVGHAGTGIVHVVSDQPKSEIRSVAEQVAATLDAIVFDWDTDHPADCQDKLNQRLRQTFDPHSVFRK